MWNQISSDLRGLQCFRLPCPSTSNVFLCNVSSLRRENNFQENTALQIYSYHHYNIIVYVIIAMTIMKVYFRMKWSSTVWRTISSTGMVRQNNIQKSMNCGFIHYDGLEEDCWLRIRFYIFWLAPLCRPWSEDFQLYLSALLSSPASPLCWFYFLPLCWFLFSWIWFFFCFHHSRRRIKWFTRGECFCRRIIWQENCFQGRGPPLTMRWMMMMMCQKCFCLLKTS